MSFECEKLEKSEQKSVDKEKNSSKTERNFFDTTRNEILYRFPMFGT